MKVRDTNRRDPALGRGRLEQLKLRTFAAVDHDRFVHVVDERRTEVSCCCWSTGARAKAHDAHCDRLPAAVHLHRWADILGGRGRGGQVRRLAPRFSLLDSPRRPLPWRGRSGVARQDGNRCPRTIETSTSPCGAGSKRASRTTRSSDCLRNERCALSSDVLGRRFDRCFPGWRVKA